MTKAWWKATSSARNSFYSIVQPASFSSVNLFIFPINTPFFFLNLSLAIGILWNHPGSGFRNVLKFSNLANVGTRKVWGAHAKDKDYPMEIEQGFFTFLTRFVFFVTFYFLFLVLDKVEHLLSDPTNLVWEAVVLAKRESGSGRCGRTAFFCIFSF